MCAAAESPRIFPVSVNFAWPPTLLVALERGGTLLIGMMRRFEWQGFLKAVGNFLVRKSAQPNASMSL
jgi:hypothetical protein